MEFRDLKSQYLALKEAIDPRVMEIMGSAQFIGGKPVRELEEMLADYVGVKHCISCANGTDALMLVLKAWGIGPGDAVFVPDFTFFASAEAVSVTGATPVFVDVLEDTFNLDPKALEQAIRKVRAEDRLTPKAVVAVDLFGLAADYPTLEPLCRREGLKLLEDGAQGFSGAIGDRRNCSFGDAATTSFFPAKPLGCYGDGGAVFTNDDAVAALIRSLAVHGKGEEKYDNVRIGYNSRLDTIQAVILQEKFKALRDYELDDITGAAANYDDLLRGVAQTPIIPQGYTSGWAQYTIKCKDEAQRDHVMTELKARGIPTMVYYPKPMHRQTAYANLAVNEAELAVSTDLCRRVLALPLSPYITPADQEAVAAALKDALHA